MYSSFGIKYAITVKLSTSKSDLNKSLYISSSVHIILFIALVLLAFALFLYYDVVSGFLPEIQQYLILIVCMVTLLQFQELFKNIFRVINKIKQVIFLEFVFAISPFFVIFFFRNEVLIEWLLGANIFAAFLNLIYSLRILRIKLSQFSFKIHKELIQIGFPLLIYNISFYLILLSVKTIASIYYDTKSFGYYALSESIVNAVFLGLHSILWYFFPKFLKQFSREQDLKKLTDQITSFSFVYINSVFTISFLAISGIPILLLFLSDYYPISSILSILLINQGILSFSAIYSSLIIAKGGQVRLATMSVIGVLVAITSALVIANLGLQIKYMALPSVCAFSVYSFLVFNFARKRFLGNVKINALRNLSPGIILGVLLILFYFILEDYMILLYSLALISFAILNIKNFKRMYSIIKSNSKSL
jgi:O-antigen/teichoic acid export membrane protein